MRQNRPLITLFLLLLVSSAAFAASTAVPLENGLYAKIAEVAPNETIPVFIGISNPYPPDQLLDEVQGMTLPQRRAYVIETLSRHFEQETGSVWSWLEDEVAQGRARKLQPVWLAHGFVVQLQANRVDPLTELDGVQRVRYDRPLRTDQVIDELPSPPLGEISELDDLSWGVEYMGAPAIWDMGYHGESVIVAIIDTGLLITHPDLADHVWTNEDEIPGNGIDDDFNGYVDDIHGWNFYDDNPVIEDVQGHGTKCAGVVAGDGTLGDSTGVAPAATVMPIRNYASGWSSEATRAAAVQYAITNGASVISCSMSYDGAYNPDYVTHRYSYQYLLAAGLISTNSTGNNNGGQIPYNVNAPANCPPPWLHPDQEIIGGVTGVMAIGAHGTTGELYTYTGNGPATWENPSWPLVFQDYPYNDGQEFGLLKPDLLAPGSVTTTSYSGGYTSFSGTSAASPGAAGSMVLLRDVHPQATPEQIAEALLMTAEDGGEPGFDNSYGAGLIRVDLASDYLDQMFDYGALTVVAESFPDDEWSITVGDGEIVRRFGAGEYIVDAGRVLPGTYTVAVDLPGNDRRVFSDVTVTAGNTTELVVNDELDELVVTPDVVIDTVGQSLGLTAAFDVENPGADSFIVRARMSPPGGRDWQPDLQWSMPDPNEIRAIDGNVFGLYVADDNGADHPVFHHFDPFSWQTTPQPERFENGIEELCRVYINHFAVLYEDKIYTLDMDALPGDEIIDSLYIGDSIMDPAGIAYHQQHFYIADNESGIIHRLDQSGLPVEQYNIGVHTVRTLSIQHEIYTGEQRLHAFCEDLNEQTYMLSLGLDDLSIENSPYFEPVLGTNPISGCVYSEHNYYPMAVVTIDADGNLDLFWREIPESHSDLSWEADIPPGGGTLGVYINNLPVWNLVQFDLVFENLASGQRDVTPVTLSVYWDDVDEPAHDLELPLTPEFTNVYPNPFNAQVTLEYSLPARAPVKLAVYDVLGREVAMLENSQRQPGMHTVTWSANRLASGVYFAVFEAGDVRQTHKLLLMK